MLKRLKILLILFLSLILTISCNSFNKKYAVDYKLIERPKMGLIFSQEGKHLFVRFPTGYVAEIDGETLRWFNDYNAEIKAYEDTANTYLSYYKAFFKFNSE